MIQAEILPADMKVLMNHIYEFKKGVRNMILFTFNQRYKDYAEKRLQSNGISYIIQPVGNDRLNLFFGKRECLDAIRMMVTRPLNQLTPEEDFISVPCWVMTSVRSANGIGTERTVVPSVSVRTINGHW